MINSILNKRYNCLKYIVEYVHSGKKYEHYKNIYIPDLASQEAYYHDGKQLVKIDKYTLISNIINHRISDIKQFYEDIENIGERTKKRLKNFIGKIESGTYTKIYSVRNNIELAIYNNQ